MEWRASLGFSIVKVPFTMLIQFVWESENTIRFRMIEGDFDSIWGTIEFRKLDEERTEFAFSSTSYIGENASRLVRLANQLNDRSIVFGINLGKVLMGNLVEWVESESKNE